MRRIVAIILVLVVGLAGHASAQSSDDRIFESPEGGIRFLVPNRWSVADGMLDGGFYIEMADRDFGALSLFDAGRYCGFPGVGFLSCEPTSREALTYYIQLRYPQIAGTITESSFIIQNGIEYFIRADNQIGIKPLAPGYLAILDWYPARDEAENALFRRVLETLELTRPIVTFSQPLEDFLNEGFEEELPVFEIPPEEGTEVEPIEEEVIVPPEPVIPTPLQLLINARIDLETLAGLTVGAERPQGWTGNTNSADPDLAITIRLDLETLARTLIGEDIPAGWFGVVASSPYAIARDIRHDLELLADAVELAPRPANWAGGSALLRCDRTTQALISLLEESTDFTLQADRTAPDFCAVASQEATVFTERFLGGAFTVAPTVATGEPRITAGDAVGFINLAGTVRGGIFPQNERIEIIARQPGDSAVLMLVRGIGFELFVDYRNTNITEAQFLALRSVGGLRVDPRCSASWCG